MKPAAVTPVIEATTLSVIIVTFNSAACLRPTLDALFEQLGPNDEVILLDNTSRDASLEIARLYESRGLKIIESKVNRGFAGGNNDAVSASGGDLILLLNPDAVLLPGAVAEVRRAFIKRPDAGIAGAKLLAGDARTILNCGGLVGACAHTAPIGRGERDAGQRDAPASVDFVIGAVYAIRRETWDALGGFDEDFNPCYYEDTDQCLRCRQLGLEVIYWPGLAAVHPDDIKSCTTGSPGFWWNHHRHRMWYQVKHAGMWALLVRVIPQEMRWYFSSQSAGLKKFMLKVYYYTARRWFARKILRQKPRAIAG